VAPIAAPDKSLVVLGARQAAQEALSTAVETVLSIADAGASIQALALATARRDAAAVLRRRDDQTGQFVPPRTRPAMTAPALPAATARVPILMYHHIADAPPSADAVRRDLSVGPAAFAQQMSYLQANGYQTIDLAMLVDHLLAGRPLPAKAIVLTFDDGYEDNYSNAYPILRRFGFGGAFFVLTDLVGQAGYASWDNLIEMSRNGMDIEAHGRTHNDLAISSAEDTTWQVAGSRAILEEKLGQRVRFYCYPSGRYTAQTIAILRDNGYTAAVTIAYGVSHKASGLFELDRIRVRGTDSLDDFAAKVAAAP
jgi:peptidoglycan/xylan/chitin deacetylase (PgdA/CDA1 family)